MNRRDKHINLRVTDKERNQLHNNAKKRGISLNEYLILMGTIESEFDEFLDTAKTLSDDLENNKISYDESRIKWSELFARYGKYFPIIYNTDSFKLESAIARMNRLIDSRYIK